MTLAFSSLHKFFQFVPIN